VHQCGVLTEFSIFDLTDTKRASIIRLIVLYPFFFGDFDVCVRRADLEYLTVAGKVESTRCTGRFHCKHLSGVFTRSLFSITSFHVRLYERE
jgi:hypothetical protein